MRVRIIPRWGELQLQAEEKGARLVSVAPADPTGVDMARVASAMRAIDEVSAGRLALPAAEEAITAISHAPPAPTWLFTLAAAAGAAALSVLFGVEHLAAVALIVASAAVGAVLRRTLAQYSTNPLLQPLCAALLAGIIGALAVRYELSSSLRLVAVCPCMIDTAEIYFSERVVGDCLRAGPIRAVIASKFLPFPGRTSPRRLMSALDGSLARLGLKTIDLYYVHYPLPLIDVGVFAEGLVEAVKSGKARAVGVANFNADQMRRIADHLARAGVPLAANQVNYSLLRRAAETNGVLEACRELDVALVAYFPLASGRLTQPSDSMGTKALLTCLADIARTHDASISQVALNWLLARDSRVIPIPGATKPHHARANLDALGWRLSETEFDAIDRASAKRGT